MKEINIDNFLNGDKKNYDAKMLVRILEVVIGKPIELIKKDIEDTQIIVTEEEIKNHVKRKIRQAKRIKEEYEKRNIPIDVNLAMYDFEPYTLEYFHKYTTIIKNKLNELLTGIIKISARDVSPILDTFLTEYDIKLDDSGNISKEDIIRLIIPTLQNISILQEKTEAANNLNTYLKFRISQEDLMRAWVNITDIYPTKALQIKDLYYNDAPGNIKLSKEQEEKLRKERSLTYTYF